MPSLYHKIGRNIKHLRKSNKQTQEDLGNILGLSKTAIVNYENAQRKISLEHIVKLCNFYEITVNDIIGYNDTAQKNKQETFDLIDKWREEFPEEIFSKNEIKLLIDFAKLLITTRSVNNG